jgi:hypothetical protein
VSGYQAQGRPVFVDFTASWCLSCQVNERVALTAAAGAAGVQRRNVVAAQGRLDAQRRCHYAGADGLGRSGVPAYALYVPGESEPQLLPEALTPGIVTDALGILIRKVEPELKLALEQRAERNNRTLEAEVCEILRVALDKEDEETAVAEAR